MREYGLNFGDFKYKIKLIAKCTLMGLGRLYLTRSFVGALKLAVNPESN